jgi:Peptidase family M28
MLVGAVVAISVVASWAASQPPPPLPGSAPATAFSAERAVEHLQVITGDRPSPVGSNAGDRIRDYLVTQLTTLGLQVQVQAGLGIGSFGHSTVAGRVENIVAALPGRDSTGRIFLVAHYDSTFGTPGAADDKAAVAAVVETVRALSTGVQLRNDVVVLLTDGEEPGLLGAAAFVAAQRNRHQTDVVLNWEATGNAGPSMLFETAPGDAELVRLYTSSALHPVGDSALAAMYEAGSQNTDFTVFKEAGFPGLNFALVDGTAYYHSSRDTFANLELSGVQHHGANMLALTRALGERDLGNVRSADDATFFTVLGRSVSYPNWLVWPLAGLAVVAVAAAALLARRRGLATVPRLLIGSAAALIPLVVAPAAAVGLWSALVAIRPGYGELLMGNPYRPEPFRWALAALTATIILAWYLLLRRRVGAVALAVGALLWPALLGVVTAALLPSMSYYGSLSAFAAAAGATAALLLGPARPVTAVIVTGAGSSVGAALLIPAGITLLGILGIAIGAAGVFFFALAGLLVLPLLETVLPKSPTAMWSILVSLTAVVVTLALTAAGLYLDRFDEEHPRTTHLTYALDANTGTARWVSTDHVPPDWTAGYATESDNGEGSLPLPYGTVPRWTGHAPALALESPGVQVISSRVDSGTRVVDLHLTSPRDADVLTLHTDRAVQQVDITIDGHAQVTSVPAETAESTAPWPYELRFYDPPPSGVRVSLRLAEPAAPAVSVSDYTVGLAAVPGFTPPPPGVDRSPAHSSDLVVVGRVHQPAAIGR